MEATFLTHLHSDHTLGYPDLVFTTRIMGRRAPLRVFGPPGLARMTTGCSMPGAKRFVLRAADDG